MHVKIQKLHPDAVVPTYTHPGDAGADLYALDEHVIAPRTYSIIGTGIALEFSEGFVALVWDRGSSPTRGWHTLGGVFDCGYRGEYNIVLYNITNAPISIRKGEKIAQLLIQPIERAHFEVVETLSETSRGASAFGSSGA